MNASTLARRLRQLALVTPAAVGALVLARSTEASPPAPLAAITAKCQTFETARAAFSVNGRGRRERMVLRMNDDGRATVDPEGGSRRYSWTLGQHVQVDEWDRPPKPEVGSPDEAYHLSDLWAACRSGFSGATWSTPVYSPAGPYVDMRLPYAWAANSFARVSMRGQNPGAADLASVCVYADDLPNDALFCLTFTILEWDVTLSQDALDTNSPDVVTPVPVSWTCSKDQPCFLHGTGWTSPEPRRYPAN